MTPPFAHNCAVFLDVDGTLVELVDHPDDVEASRELVAVLERLYDVNDGALALVSGRDIASVDAIFAPLRLPVAGQHGYERRNGAGSVIRSPVDAEALSSIRPRLERFVARYPGAFVEDKGAAVALHFRRAPEAGTEAEALASELENELPEMFRVQRGKMVVEVKPSGGNKGDAIAAFMAEPPFRGRTPLFLGDDVTDEDGFRWVNRRGGISIKVGPGKTEASYRLEDAGAVLGWLRQCVNRLTEHED